MVPTVIQIHSQAPAKPAWGEACNGCGVCCLLEPCPVGVLVSRRRRGACAALRWQQSDGRYRCGVLTDTQRYTRLTWPLVNKLFARLMRRMIYAGRGRGCDAQVEVSFAPPGV